MRKLTETRLRKRLKRLAQPQSGWTDVFPAVMGKADGTVLTNIPGIVWVHNVLNGQDLMVYNGTVQNTPLLEVDVGKRVDEPGLWQVKGSRQTFSVPSSDGPTIADHHERHEFPNADTVWVDRKQIKHLTVLVYDAAGFIVKIFGGIVLTANGITKIATQTVDLSSYVPSEGAVFVSIESDDDGVVSVNTGTAFASPEIATVDDIPSPDEGKYTRAYVILYEGQPALSNNDIVVPMPPDFNPTAFSSSTHNHDSRYPRKYPGKTTAPTVNDDSGDGYAVDDIWVDETNDKAYIALDVTVGAAVWQEIGAGGGSSSTHWEPVTTTLPKEFEAFRVDGALAVATNVASAILITRYITLSYAYIHLKENGTSGSTIVDINLNGSTIFPTSGNRPTLAHDAVYAISGVPDTVDLVPGDVLTLDIDQVAGGTPADLRVALMEVFNDFVFDSDNNLVMEEVPN